MKMITIVMRNFVAIICLIILSGCSLLSPVKVNVPEKYRLDKIPPPMRARSSRAIIYVPPTETRPMYNTPQMAYSLRPYHIAYFSKNEWAETPGQMLQPLLVQTLQNTNHYKAIVTPPYAGNYDYILNTELLEFIQDFSQCPPLLRMSVRAQLLRSLSNRVIAVRQFSVIQPLARATPYGGVFAANDATAYILQRIALFSMERIH